MKTSGKIRFECLSNLPFTTSLKTMRLYYQNLTNMTVSFHEHEGHIHGLEKFHFTETSEKEYDII